VPQGLANFGIGKLVQIDVAQRGEQMELALLYDGKLNAAAMA
jgi:hypothetical protein